MIHISLATNSLVECLKRQGRRHVLEGCCPCLVFNILVWETLFPHKNG